MTWRVESADGRRFVEGAGARIIDSDPESGQMLRALEGNPVERGALAGSYDWPGRVDRVWLWLAACSVVPYPRNVTGEVPNVPPVEGTFPADAVF